MKKIALPILFLAVLFLPGFASAETVVSGPIVSDTTWSRANVYVVDSNFSISAGATLTVESGTVVKARNTGRLDSGILGNLIINGSSEMPVYFTSWSDDSVGGDTNGDGPSVGTPGSWQGLYFKPGSAGNINYLNLSYAGYGGPYAYDYGHLVGIENDGGAVEIRNSNIHDNYNNLFDWVIGHYRGGNSISNKSGTLSVSDSVIDNSANGINIESGTTTISNSIIKNNTGYSAGYGVYAPGPEPLTLLNNTFSNNAKTAFVSASKDFTHSGNTSNDISLRGFQIGGYAKDDSTLSGEDLPLIIDGSLFVKAGDTLTIASGTVIKMGDVWGNGAVYVAGTLIARGTEDKKIYFTSTKDDSVGGDTNGDGSNSVPAPRNWNAIYLEAGSKADFDNVVVRYGGFNYNGEYLPGVAAAVYQRGSEFLVSNSLFEHNAGTAIFQDAGTTSVDSSEIINGNHGIWSRGGLAKISQSSFYDNLGLSVYNQSGPTIDATNNWWGDSSGPHNISTTTSSGTGSRVSGDILYDPWLTSSPNAQPNIDPVIIVPGIMGSAYRNGKLVIDPILHTYDDLIATLIANGYEEGVDLFTFPYEWRDSNVLTANLLKDKIDEVKNICHCSKVDIVAHSMGGLAAREYIQSLQYQNDVDQIIFLGTPHRGSPRAYWQWEGGEFPPGFREFLVEQFFISEAHGNGYKSIFNYIHTRPILSVQELLPIFDYLKEEETGILRTYPNNYPKNIFLEIMNTRISKLLNSEVQITNIIGNTGSSTIKNITVTSDSNQERWTHGEVDGFDLGVGDNTVTTYGATLDTSIQNEEWNGVAHNNLPRETSARIFNILTGKIADDVVYSSSIERILTILLLSPIDVTITAPDGKKIGKNFATGGEYNEIPLAFYSGYQTDDEYITIPNPLDGEYKIEIQGTGNGGEYGVLTSYISESFATTTEITGLTQPNQITNLRVDVDTENPENLESNKEVTKDGLTAGINEAYDLGWLKNQGVRDTLIWQVNKIFETEGTLFKNVLKSWGNSLKMLLDGGKITQEAYNIIKSDINWLILNN